MAQYISMSKKYAYEEFSDIYARQSSRLYKLCYIYLGNEHDAQDAVHSIFMKMLEKNIRFKNENHETAWFCVAAKNYCYNILKSSWRKKRVQYQETEHDNIHKTPNMDMIEEKIMMREALLKLPMKQQEVLYLYYYDGMSVRDIAELLNRKESTVLSQMSAGREKLRKLLAKGENKK